MDNIYLYMQGDVIGAPGQSEPDRKAKTTKTKKQDANQTYKKKELMDGGKKTNTAYKYGEGHITEYADEVKPEFHGGESYKYSAHKTGEASSKYFKTEKEAQEYLAGGKKNDLQQNVDALNEFHDKAWKSGADKDALRTLIKQRADAMPDGTVLARVKQETSSTYTSKGIMQQTETKMSKLYKINGQWSRYKDGSGKIDDIASEVIHGSGKLQTLDAAKQEAAKLQGSDEIKTRGYGTKERFTSTRDNQSEEQPKTTSRNAKYDTSRSTKSTKSTNLNAMDITELRALAKKYGVSQKVISMYDTDELRMLLTGMVRKK